MYSMFVLCHIVFLYDSCNIFIMCKIPPNTVSRGACFQNSPTPSASLLCVEINMVLKFLLLWYPAGTWKVSREKWLRALTSKYTIHGSKPILLVFWDLWVKGPYTRPLPPPALLFGCRYQSEMGIRNCNKSHWVSCWVSKLIIMVIKKNQIPDLIYLWLSKNQILNYYIWPQFSIFFPQKSQITINKK